MSRWNFNCYSVRINQLSSCPDYSVPMKSLSVSKTLVTPALEEQLYVFVCLSSMPTNVLTAVVGAECWTCNNLAQTTVGKSRTYQRMSE